jgi:hypothetical protein
MTTKKKGEIDLKAIRPLARKALQSTLRYTGIMFFVLVAAVYGFVLFRINTLSSAQPTDSDISAQAKSTAIPKIDPKVVQQIQTLKDNSTNVQTLFEENRGNPFQENK